MHLVACQLLKYENNKRFWLLFAKRNAIERNIKKKV